MTVQQIEELCLKRGAGASSVEIGQEWILGLFEHSRCIQTSGEAHRQRSLADTDRSFDRDKIFAYLNLDDNELFIYQRLYDLLVKDVSTPDLVVYLQSPTDVLLRRQRERPKEIEDETPEPAPDYLRELNEAYQHFFFHYTATPLLVVETSHLDLAASDAALDDLIKQIRGMGRGTQYYVPRA